MRHAYGPDPRQWVELTPGTDPDTVVPVVIHGGYWRALHAEDHRFMLQALVAFGATLAKVEYRLMPGARLDGILGDLRAALRLILEQHPQARLVLVGHSAGAHFALSAAGDPGSRDRIAGVIALSGVNDLYPLRDCFLQDELSLTHDEAEAHSLRPSQARPPSVYVNVSAETHEFLRGSALMASQGKAAWRILPGANHMSLLWVAADAMPDLFETLMTLEPLR